MANINCLDTNAVLRLQLLDVPEQHYKVCELVADQSVDFMIPDIVFFEINFVLAKNYGFSRQVIIEFIHRLVSIPNIVCDYNHITATLEQYGKHPKLSFADCYLTEYAKAKQYGPLWTFDRKLAAQCETAREIK